MTYKQVKKHQFKGPPTQKIQHMISQCNLTLEKVNWHTTTAQTIIPPGYALAVYDDDTGQMMEYRDLIKHPDPNQSLVASLWLQWI